MGGMSRLGRRIFWGSRGVGLEGNRAGGLEVGERAASALELKMGNRQAECIGNGGKDLGKKGLL